MLDHVETSLHYRYWVNSKLSHLKATVMLYMCITIYALLINKRLYADRKPPFVLGHTGHYRGLDRLRSSQHSHLDWCIYLRMVNYNFLKLIYWFNLLTSFRFVKICAKNTLNIGLYFNVKNKALKKMKKKIYL